MLEHLTFKQIAEWEAFDRIDPIGTWRQDYRFGQLISVVMNLAIKIHGKKGHDSKNYTPLDFMPQWDEIDENKTDEGQSVDEMKEVMMSVAKSSNRNVNWRQKQNKKFKQ